VYEEQKKDKGWKEIELEICIQFYLWTCFEAYAKIYVALTGGLQQTLYYKASIVSATLWSEYI